MPHHPDHPAAAPEQAEERPAAIWTSPQTWSLNADPDRLDAAAEALRALGTAAGSARTTVDLAALRVFSEEAWTGLTAEAFQDHRGKLSGDLGEFGTAAGPAADALQQVAGVLRCGQEMLDRERDRLRDIPAFDWLPGTVFFPAGEPEATEVRDAMAAAEEIRSWVDDQIAGQSPVFRWLTPGLTAISDTRRPHTLRHTNLNAGMGRGAGTVRDNLDELAVTLAAGNPDVITLQEVWSRNLYGEEGLLSLLEQQTGSRWQVASFATALVTHTDDPDNIGTQPFGNAILVRTDGVVEDHDWQPSVELPDPSDVDVQGRRAAVAEITVDRPGEV